MPKTPALLTKQELADRFLVDVRSITNWVAEGMPERRRSGKPGFEWADCLRWYTQKIRDDERAKRHAGGDADIQREQARARLRQSLADAEKAEIAVRTERRESVTVSFMADRYEQIAMRIRRKLLQIPAGWAARLGTCVTYTDRRLVLVEAVNEFLPELRELSPETEPIAESDLPPAESA